MIPLIPALALAFLSFIASAFVILRIVIPILPPHPLSKRVSPAEFGLPRFRSLSAADKGHVWLAVLDLVALAVFIWEAATETLAAPMDSAVVTGPSTSVRLWIVLSVRQTCLMVIASIALLHIRLGRPVSFGKGHWLLWAPTMLLVITSTAFAGIMSAVGIDSLFYGLAAYSSTVVILTTGALGYLLRTLCNIKRNLAAIEEDADPWPPVKEMEKPRPSFTSDEIEAMKEGASWITSNASSRRNSISTWSFSTHHGHGRSRHGSQSSIPGKASHWFGISSHNEAIPPVPPLPPSYSPNGDGLEDPDPFRRDIPTSSPEYNYHRQRLGSQSSWLTSTNGSYTAMSAWSFPTTQHEGSIRNASTVDLHSPLTSSSSRPVTPALADAQVLGGYGYAPGSPQAEKGLASLAASSSTITDISVGRVLGWLVAIWLPLGLGFPYMIVASQHAVPDTIVSVLLAISVTLSSPVLALNIIFNSPLPIPVGLFESQNALPVEAERAPSRATTLAGRGFAYEYKRSMSTSVTVVEGRRSGDVWIAKGDAVNGKTKIGRAVEMLSSRPKLSVLPPEESEEIIPPVPIRDESSLVIGRDKSRSYGSTQFGKVQRESKTSSHMSGGDENLAFTAKVMIAQRHYSALAQTVVVPSSSLGEQDAEVSNQLLSATTGIAVTKPSAHLRSRSISFGNCSESPSLGNISNVSGPPPSDPLPPTPPNVRAARLAQLRHKKSFSSGFSFGAVDGINEIDALTAGVLPLLVPGLKVGDNMIIKGELPGTFSKIKGFKAVQKLSEFGAEFSSPEFHSTPARRRLRDPRGRKQSGHKSHFSLPSLGLGKNGAHSLATWSAEIKEALEDKVVQYTAIPSNVEIGRRNTVFGSDSIPNYIPIAHLRAARKEEGHKYGPAVSVTRSKSTRSLGLRADVPHNIDEARHSALTLNTMLPPASAASTATLFEDFEAGLDSGPLAESTPHSTVTQKPKSKYPPPSLPLDTNAASKRCSSIIYKKSDNEDHSSPNETTRDMPFEQATTNNYSTVSSFAQWSTRAVRPLIPKVNKLQRNGSGKTTKGLRPLSLLKDRNTNAIPENLDDVSPAIGSLPSIKETRPLTLGKRKKSKPALKSSLEPVNDENAPPSRESSLSSKSKGLKPLKLVRTDTIKMRGALRKTEVLPEVVIRPPSTAENTASFIYNYHD
ncbi:hypothetical protein AX15_007238 [Amanita polypyramis BW_CC]|nr:hypothetical protein AX15_007238 [Amanita polypyramis BW_CC]